MECHHKLEKYAEAHIDIGGLNENILTRTCVCIKGLIILHCSLHQ